MSDTINGTNGNNTINGTSADNLINADGGDLLVGGDDIVFARGGADTVNGELGADLLFGQGGGDSLSGGAGNDELVGGLGDDTLDGSSGTDIATYEEAVFGDPLNAITFTDLGPETGWRVTTGTEGTDTIFGVEIVTDADGGRVLLVGGGGFATLQEAIDAANSGDTILIAGGTYAGDATITDKALTLRGQGAGTTILDGQITILGTLSGDTVIEDLSIDAAGEQHGILYNALANGTIGLTVDGVAISGAVESGLLYVRPGNGSNPSNATQLLSSIAIRDSAFADNGTGAGSAGRAHVNLFGFNGDLTVTGNDFTVTSGAGRKAFAWTGAPRTGDLSPAGDVVFTGNDFTGSYTSDVIAFYYQESYASFTAGGNTADVSAPWGVLNADSAPVALDVSTFFAGTPLNAAGPIAVLQGADGVDNALVATAFGDVLLGRGGADTLNAGDGADFITGSAGMDSIAAGGGDDLILAATTELPDTAIDGGAGADTLRITSGTGAVVLGAEVTGVETIEVATGTNAVDIDAGAVLGVTVLTGNDGANALEAGDGAQTVTGNGGNDTLTGGEGDDSLTGGADIDTAVFAGVLTADAFSVADGKWVVASGAEGTDTLATTEIVQADGARFLLVGAGGFATIQAAVDAANSGDTILVADGRYDGTVTIGKGITLLGSNRGVAGDGARDPESIVAGAVTIATTERVVVDGFQFLNDRAYTLSISDAYTALSIQQHASAASGGHVVQNSVFTRDPATDPPGFNPNAFAGSSAQPTHRGIELAAVGAGAAVTIAGNLFTGTNSYPYAGDSWRSAIYSNGGAGSTTISGNEFSNVRTALNLDDFTSAVVVTGNEFASAGSAISLGGAGTVAGDLSSISDNSFGRVDTDVNGQNLAGTQPVTIDVAALGGPATGPAEPFAALGGAAADVLIGASGLDALSGNGGADTITGGDGNDTLIAGAGADSLNGGGDADSLDGGADADVLLGGGGNDVVSGAAGTDSLAGGDGMDTLNGGTEGDTLAGGEGNDVLIGGDGIDTASYASGLTIASFSLVGGAWQVDAGAEGIDSLDGVEAVSAGGITYRLVGAGGYTSIQAAIDAADPDDVILIAPGTYTETSAGVGGGQPQGLYINKAGLTLVGFSAATGLAVASAQEAKDAGPVIIAGEQNQFGANHWIDVGGTGTVLRGLHLQAGPETNNKLLEIWADATIVEDNYLNVGTTNPTAALYLQDTSVGATDVLLSYDIRNNILNEAISISNGVGDPAVAPTPASTQRITGNVFEGGFDYGTGAGRLDAIILQGQASGIPWLLEPVGTPWIVGNTFADNASPFLLRGLDNDAANLPDAAGVADFLANNGDAATTYAYVLDDEGDLVTVTRNFGSGPVQSLFVMNNIGTLNLALDATPDAVFGGQRLVLRPTDTLIVQSGAATTSAAILVDDVTVQATANSADLDLTLGTTLVDGTPIAGGGVVTLTLGDHAPGLGANVDVTGNALGNAITGNSGANRIDGAAGNDTLAGGAGGDTLLGGADNDVIATDGGDSIDGGGGTDEVQSSVSFSLAADATGVENLTLTGTDDIDGTGDAGDNAIVGNGGANLIDGGAGADAMAGGGGDDTYVVDDLGDTVTEAAGEGTDLVLSSVDFTLGAEVEDLTLTGAADIDGTGNAQANTILGNGGANVIDGGAGADAMAGGDGDDTYVVDDVGDGVTEAAGEGTDLVLASVDYTLGAEVEDLTLTGATDLDGTGNAGANAITGNSGANVLTGAGGDDTLVGGTGFDTAAFSGNFGDYTIVRDGAGLLVIGADGEDSLEGMEALQFADRRVILVDDDGSNGLTTIQAGVNAAIAGDTVLVLDGSYAEASVTVDRPVTLLGANAGTAGTGAREAESSLIGKFRVASDGVTIDGFRITGSDAAVQAHASLAAYDDLTIRNNLIEGTTDTPIRFGLGFGGGIGSENWSITDNLIDGIAGAARSGMVLFNVTGLTVTGNTIEHDNAAFGGRRGINLDGIVDGTVSGNTIDLGLTAPADETAANTAAPWAIQISMSDREASNVEVSGNTVGGARYGIITLNQRGSDGVSITGNTITDTFHGIGLQVGGTAGTGSVTNLTVTGNDISSQQTGIRFGTTVVGGSDDPYTNIEVSGNTVALGNPAGFGLWMPAAHGTTTVGTGADAGTILGTTLGDLVEIASGAGEDSIAGLDGNDTLAGAGGNDTLSGGEGDDLLRGGAGADAMAGGGGDDTYVVDDAGDGVTEAAGEGTDLVLASVDFTLGAEVENLTLTDGASDLEDFEDFDLGPISNGENGWRYVGGAKDQEVVDVAGDQKFRMSSDPSVADFSGPYSPALPATAGEPGTTADYDSMQITFTFEAVSPGDNSRLEVDFGIDNGTDRNNFMVIENTAAGIRIAVADPLLSGDFDTGETLNDFTAFTGNRTLVSGVDNAAEHELTMVVRFFDGPDNDVVDFYLNGDFIGSSTTFENFRVAIGQVHETAAEANQVSRLFFRGSAGAAPVDGPGGQNQGFLFDDISASVFDAEGPSGTGNGLANTILGNGGANALSGLGDADTLAGGLGDDTLTGGEGDDSLDGGLATDTAVFAAALTAADIQASGGGFTVTTGGAEGTDTLANVEIVEGSAGRFLLVGNGGFATLAAALAVAMSGDTILLQGGTQTGTFTIGMDLTILGRDGAAIEGGIVLTAGDLAIADVAIEQPVGPNAGILVLATAGNGSLTLSNVDLTGPGSGSGSRGIEAVANAAPVSVTGGTIDAFSSGIYLNPGASLVVSGTTFTGNAAGIGTEGPAVLDVQGATFDGNGEAIGLTGGTLNPEVTLDDNTYVGATDEVKLYGPVTEVLPGIFDGVVVSAPASLQAALDSADAGETVYVGAGSYGAGPFTVPAAVAAVQGGALAVAGTLQLAAAGALTLLGTAEFDVLGTAGADTVTGNDGANALSGDGGADSLAGGGGGDTLHGGAGADAMAGGAGDDIYVVDDAGDTVTEAAAEGTDRALASVNYTLDDSDVEQLELTGTDSINGTGNSADNLIIGNGVANQLRGQAGNDTLIGGLGGDTLLGGQGNDSMDGGTGVDALDYNTSTPGVSIVANLTTGIVTGIGFDTVANIENVLGTSEADNITGSAANNRLVGRGGDDILSGEGGNDTLEGGAGGDFLAGGLGTDTAIYSNTAVGVAASLLTGIGTAGEALGDVFSAIENFLGGTGADTLEGDNGANRIEGSGGADLLRGRGGDDTILGGAGIDTVTYDTATTSVSVALGAGTATDGEGGNDSLASVENAVGSAFADSISGSASANLLDGGDGDDALSGGNGNDTLRGGQGNDQLTGGLGADVLTGGAGFDVLTGGADNDIFRFVADSDMGTVRGSLTDRIAAFEGANAVGGDTIDISGLDANLTVSGNQTYAFIGNGPVDFTAAGQVRAVVDGGTTYVELNNDADLDADLVIRITGAVTLGAGDFSL